MNDSQAKSLEQQTAIDPYVAADDPAKEPPVEDIGAPPRAKSRDWIIRLTSIVLVVGGWQIVGAHVNPLFLSTPTAILTAAKVMGGSGELWSALLSSLRTLSLGFVIASVIGIVAGLLIGRYRAVDVATDWLVNALNATPLVAVIPLVVLWFGLEDTAKLFIVVILTVFSVLINTAAGVRNVPPALIDVSTAFAANEWQVFIKIILPSALPYIMTGLRVGIGRAIIGMVVAEFFTAINGLGAIIVKSGNQYDTAAMFVPILILMLLGVLLTYLVRRAEELVAPWRQAD